MSQFLHYIFSGFWHWLGFTIIVLGGLSILTNAISVWLRGWPPKSEEEKNE